MKRETENTIVTIVFTIFIILAFAILERMYHNSTNSVIVHEDPIVDSIKKENEKLIIEVNNLDSIKNAKLIEIKTLDNDSTIKLFYELIRQ